MPDVFTYFHQISTILVFSLGEENFNDKEEMVCSEIWELKTN